MKQDILSCIDKLKQLNCKSIAIICKDDKELDFLFKTLADTDIVVYSENDMEFNSNTCLLTVQTSKGLEFDGIIIANENSYIKTSSLETKSLYVAMTRALHELIILY